MKWFLLPLPYQLKSKAKRTKAVSTLMLPQSDAQVKPGDVCHVAGWGLTSINGTKVSSCLREAELIIQEDQECEKIFYNYFKTIQICAGDPNNVQDASKVGIKHLRTKYMERKEPGRGQGVKMAKHASLNSGKEKYKNQIFVPWMGAARG